MTAIVWAALGIAAIAVAGLVGFGIAALVARKEAGKAEKQAAELAVELKVAVANAKTEAARADFQEGRANELDAAITKCAAEAVGPVAGSFVGLLQAADAARARAASREGPGVVHNAGAPSEPAAADRADPDRLLDPGE